MKKLLLALCISVLACMPVLAWDTEEQNKLSMETGGYFEDSVRNDSGGHCRLFKYSAAEHPAEEIAERYYRAFFQDDLEVHFLINFARMETTRLNYGFGTLSVTTFSYYDGEEHDAKLLPGGEMLSSTVLDVTANDYSVTEAPSESAVQPQEDGVSDEAKYTTKKKIKKLQKALRARGYYSGEATGKLDEATRTAIRKFQANSGMEVTGCVTKELYKALV